MSRIGTSIDVPTCLYINISIISIKPPQEIGEPMHKQMRYNRNALERGMDETRNDIIDSRFEMLSAYIIGHQIWFPDLSEN